MTAANEHEVEGMVPSQWYLDMKIERDTYRQALALVLAEIWAPDGGQQFQRLGAIRAAEAGLRGDSAYIAARKVAPLIASGMKRALSDGSQS